MHQPVQSQQMVQPRPQRRRIALETRLLLTTLLHPALTARNGAWAACPHA